MAGGAADVGADLGDGLVRRGRRRRRRGGRDRRAFAAAGADLIDVSAGQTSTRARPVYGRMFQTPFADRIRNEAGIATMAVGNIYEADHVNTIVMAGRADLCCLARPHLADPHWTLRAAAEQGYDGIAWPQPVPRGRRAAPPPRAPGRRDGGARLMGRLDGRHALVTGGGSGIGAAIAGALAAEGARLTLRRPRRRAARRRRRHRTARRRSSAT